MSITYDDLYDFFDKKTKKEKLNRDISEFLNNNIYEPPRDIKLIYSDDIKTVVSNACLINEIKQENGTRQSYMLLMSKFLLHEFYVNYDKYIGKIPNEYFINGSEERKTQIMELLRKLSESFKNMRYENGQSDKIKEQIDNDIQFLNTNNYLYIPVGFATTNINIGGHAVSFIIKKIEDSYTIYYLNEGYGSGYFFEEHGEKVQGFINIKNINELKLKFFLLCIRFVKFNDNNVILSNLDLFLEKVFFKMAMENSEFEINNINIKDTYENKTKVNIIDLVYENNFLDKTYKEFDNLEYKKEFLSTPQIVGNCGFIACTIPYYLLIDEFIKNDYIEETLHYMKECISSIVFGLYLDYLDNLLKNDEKNKITPSDREIIYYYNKLIKKAKKDGDIYKEGEIEYVFGIDNKMKIMMNSEKITKHEYIYSEINNDNFLLSSINNSINETKEVLINYKNPDLEESEIGDGFFIFDGSNISEENMFKKIIEYMNQYETKNELIKGFAFKNICIMINKCYNKIKDFDFTGLDYNISGMISEIENIIVRIKNMIIQNKYYVSFDFVSIKIILNYFVGKFFHHKKSKYFYDMEEEDIMIIKEKIIYDMNIIDKLTNYRDEELVGNIFNIINTDEIKYLIYVPDGNYEYNEDSEKFRYYDIYDNNYTKTNVKKLMRIINLIQCVFEVSIDNNYDEEFIFLSYERNNNDYKTMKKFYGLNIDIEKNIEEYEYSEFYKNKYTHINIISKIIDGNYEIIFNKAFFSELKIYNENNETNKTDNEIYLSKKSNSKLTKNKLLLDLEKFFTNSTNFIINEVNYMKKLYMLVFLISVFEYYNYEITFEQYKKMEKIINKLNNIDNIEPDENIIKNNIELCFLILSKKSCEITINKTKIEINNKINKIASNYKNLIFANLKNENEKAMLTRKIGIYIQSILIKLFPINQKINNNLINELFNNFQIKNEKNYNNEKYKILPNTKFYSRSNQNIIIIDKDNKNNDYNFNMETIQYLIPHEYNIYINKYDFGEEKSYENFTKGDYNFSSYNNFTYIVNEKKGTKILYFMGSNSLFPVYYEINGICHSVNIKIFELYYNPKKYDIYDNVNKQKYDLIIPINLQYKFISNYVFIKKADGVIESLDKKDSSEKIIINNNSGDFIYNSKTYYDMYKVFKIICEYIELTNLLIISNLYEIIMYEEDSNILIIELNNYDIKFTFNKTSKILTYDKYTVILNKISNINNFVNNARETMLNALIIYDNVKYKIILFSDINYKKINIGDSMNEFKIIPETNNNSYYEIYEFTPNYDNFIISSVKQAKLLYFSAFYFNDFKSLYNIYYICSTFFRNHKIKNINEQKFYKKKHTNIHANYFNEINKNNENNENNENKHSLYLSLKSLENSGKLLDFIKINFNDFEIKTKYKKLNDKLLSLNDNIYQMYINEDCRDCEDIYDKYKNISNENTMLELYLLSNYYIFTIINYKNIVFNTPLKNNLFLLLIQDNIKKELSNSNIILTYEIKKSTNIGSEIKKVVNKKFGHDKYYKVSMSEAKNSEIGDFFNNIIKINFNKEEVENLHNINYDFIKEKYNDFYSKLDNNNNKITIYKCSVEKLGVIRESILNNIIKKYNREYKTSKYYFINIALNISYIIINLIDETLKLNIRDPMDKDKDYEVNDIYEYVNILSQNLSYVENIENDDDINKLNETIKLYENFFGFPAKPEQINVIKEVFEDLKQNKKPRIHQLLMGGGKTSFIIPIILLYCIENNKYKNLFYILPTTLVKQSVEIITKYISHIRPYTILTTNITRYEDKLDDLIKDSEKNITILSDTSIKSHLLNNKKDNKETILEQVETLVITDEIDDVLDPLKSELNYPEKQDEFFISYREIKFNLIYNIVREICLNKFMMVKYNRDTRVNHLILNNPNDISEIYNELLVKGFFITNEYFNKYSEYIDYEKLIKKENFIKKTPEENSDDANNIKKEKIIIKTIYDLFENMIPIYLSKLYNYNFGFQNDKESMNDKDYLLAIPYKASRKPLIGSEFSSIDITLGFTIISYFINGLRNDDINILLEHLYKNYEATQNQKFNQYEKIYNKLFSKYTNINLNLNPFYKDMNSLEKLKFDESIIHYFLFNIVLKYVNQDMEYYNISYYDIMSSLIVKNNIGLTGTPFINLPYKNTPNLKTRYIESIKLDEQSNLNMIYGITNIKSNQVNNHFINNDINKLFNICRDYDCLIDAGALLLQYTNFEVAQKLKSIMGDKYIIYLDDNDNKMVLYDNNKNISLSEFNNINLNNQFVYFDNAHITGIDIKQKINAKGVCTLNNNSKFRDVSQGIFRLRKLDKGQHIDFFYNENTKNTIKKTCAEFCDDEINNTHIIYWLLKNGEEYQNGQQNKFLQQMTNVLIRNIYQCQNNVLDNVYFEIMIKEPYKSIVSIKFIEENTFGDKLYETIKYNNYDWTYIFNSKVVEFLESESCETKNKQDEHINYIEILKLYLEELKNNKNKNDDISSSINEKTQISIDSEIDDNINVKENINTDNQINIELNLYFNNTPITDDKEEKYNINDYFNNTVKNDNYTDISIIQEIELYFSHCLKKEIYPNNCLGFMIYKKNNSETFVLILLTEIIQILYYINKNPDYFKDNGIEVLVLSIDGIEIYRSDDCTINKTNYNNKILFAKLLLLRKVNLDYLKLNIDKIEVGALSHKTKELFGDYLFLRKNDIYSSLWETNNEYKIIIFSLYSKFIIKQTKFNFIEYICEDKNEELLKTIISKLNRTNFDDFISDKYIDNSENIDNLYNEYKSIACQVDEFIFNKHIYNFVVNYFKKIIIRSNVSGNIIIK